MVFEEQEKIETLKMMLKESKNIVFFGGAGVSTESGIPDFRSARGLYSETLKIELSPEELVSHAMFFRYTEEFYSFYKKRLVYLDAKPNAAHYALAKLEQIGKLQAIITQNIDGLHQIAGAKNVYELHGSFRKNACITCGKEYDVDFILQAENIPYCTDCGGIVKPKVVLYGESLDPHVIDNSIKAIKKADMLIIGGTSLVVYPAAGLVNYFQGKYLVLINKTSTPADRKAELLIHGNIGKVLGLAVGV